MIKLTKTSGIIIPRIYENEQWYKNIKTFLTRHSKDYQKSTFTTNEFFLEGPTFLKIPRFFPVHNFLDEDLFEMTDKINPGKDIEITHKIQLRDNLQKNIVDYMLTNKNGIIQANPGSGKTVVSIYVVAELKKKCFILVHRDSLAHQWIGPGSGGKKQGFLDYSSLTEDQICRLTSANYKDALQKDVIVCTDQTFTSILRGNKRIDFLTELNNAEIGIFIADEVHTSVGAPTFAECSIHMPTDIVFGLSATPKRWDGNEEIMKCHLGDIFIPLGKSSTMDANISVILFDSGLLPKSQYYLFYGGFFQKSRYFSLLKKSQILIVIIIGLMEKFVKDNRKIIMMSERIKFLELIEKILKGYEIGRFYGNGTLKELEKQITLATPGKMRDGVDAVEKDCLILTSPIQNINQMSGRVLRIKEGKSKPIIIDLCDIGVKEIRQTLLKRLEFYQEKGWNIKFIQVEKNGNKKELFLQQVENMIKGENE